MIHHALYIQSVLKHIRQKEHHTTRPMSKNECVQYSYTDQQNTNY